MATTKKKVVTKEELRRYMKEKQSGSKSTSKKVDHPLAKYNSLNQLVCVLCQNVLKNELLWTAHLQSKQHKEKALAIKTQGPEKPSYLVPSVTKRKAEEHSTDVVKKRKNDSSASTSKGLPTDFFDNDVQKSKSEIRERVKAALLAEYSSSSSSSEAEGSDGEIESENTSGDMKAPVAPTAKIKGLPADFFDAGNGPSETEPEEPSAKPNKKMAEILPEGFFDDPKMDAKVRQVEYKDKMDEEWGLFQKAMKEEAHVSEVIMEEDDEQANLDRNIDEIDDQIQRWREVENLHVKKENILKNSADGIKKADSDEEGNEDEQDEFLDWRAKQSMK